MKDNFSSVAKGYQQYRPTYPDELISFIHSLKPKGQKVWDCATGSGQLAKKLAKLYPEIYATDISESQLQNAVKMDNIFYSLQAAEETSFPIDYFDVITVGQAVHWFQFERFWEEVRRVGREKALIVLVGYNNPKISPEIQGIFDHFYNEIVGPYWDDERRYIEEEYQTIGFPFQEIALPPMAITCEWALEQFVGYLETWSAVAHYKRINNTNPVDLVKGDLREAWGDGKMREVRFPLIIKAGWVNG